MRLEPTLCCTGIKQTDITIKNLAEKQRWLSLDILTICYTDGSVSKLFKTMHGLYL